MMSQAEEDPCVITAPAADDETDSPAAIGIQDTPEASSSHHQEEPSSQAPTEDLIIKVEVPEVEAEMDASSSAENLAGLPGLLIYNEFCLEMSLSTDIQKTSVQQLADTLQKFFNYVRVKPAAVLGQLFDQVCQVIEAYQKVSLRNDPRFKKVLRVYWARLENLKANDGRSNSSAAPQITEQLSMFCLRKLLFCTQLRPNHPTGLFNLALFYIVVYMSKGTTHWTETKALLTSMRRSSFACRYDLSRGLKYIILRRGGRSPTAGRIFEVPGNPICPFKILRLFMSKLSPSSNHLWQRPKDHTPSGGEAWFYPDANSALNIEWLPEMTEWASMTVSYSNMSLVLTPTSVIDATLADPVFAQTIADEVKDIPEPPTYDTSRLETALPGGQDKLEIKLLSSSEAQVEIRMTAIMWKELFPEWDRIRLESGYQNHVDFMHHLLEAHRSCGAVNCSISASWGTGEDRRQSTRLAEEEKRKAIHPIKVEQRGIHNSSVLTVVNNNTVPQAVSGAQNVIVPLNDLLKSLGAGAGPIGHATVGATANPGNIMNSVLALNALQQQNVAAAPTSQAQLNQSQQIAQNVLSQFGTGSSVVLPSLAQTTPSGPVHPITGLIGGELPAPPGSNAFAQGFQSILQNVQPNQGMSAAQGLVQAANILSAASQHGTTVSTSSFCAPQAAMGVPAPSGLPNPLLPLQGVHPGLLNTLAGQGILAQPPAGLTNLAGSQVVPIPSPITQGTGHSSIPSSLTANQLSAISKGAPPGSTFVITDQGIVALPSLQHQQVSQTIAATPSPRIPEVKMKNEPVAISSSGREELSHNQVSNLQQTLSEDPTTLYAAESEQSATEVLLHSGVTGTSGEDAPLDLSIGKDDGKPEVATETSPGALTIKQEIASVGEATQPVTIHERNKRVPVEIRPMPTSSIQSLPMVRHSPPPPYPGIRSSIRSRITEGISDWQPAGDVPSKDYNEYLRLASRLKRKGKSVRELLDSKRRNLQTGSSDRGTPLASRKSIVSENRIKEVTIERMSQVPIACQSPERQAAHRTPVENRPMEQLPVGQLHAGQPPVEAPPAAPLPPDQQPSSEQFSTSTRGEPELPRPTPVVPSGRKSRRKPQHVFKRQVFRAEEYDES